VARPKLPRELTEPGERLLAWGIGEGGQVMASTRAIYLPSAGPLAPEEVTRLPWTGIDRATWEDPEVVIEGRLDGSPRRWRVALSDSGRLPEVIRERVNSSIVISEHVDLVDEGGARIVGRRGDADEPVQWSITFDPGLDPQDPQLRAAAVNALADLRDSLGI
jgi:hypothetical protein